MKALLTASILAVAVVVSVSCYSGNTNARHTFVAKMATDITAQQAQQWMRKDWTGDAKPYQMIERDIDQAIANGKNPKTLLEQDKKMAQKNPKDPQAQFRWGYAGWKMMTPTSGYWEKHLYLDGVFEALDNAPSPNTYEYARLRYLVGPHSAQTVNLGERLLSKSGQKDIEVKSHLVGDYIQLIGAVNLRPESLKPQLQTRAIALAKEVITARPSNAKYYASLGSVYVSCWTISRSRKDASLGVTAYQEYLRLASPDDELRPQVLAVIKDLQKTPASH